MCSGTDKKDVKGFKNTNPAALDPYSKSVLETGSRFAGTVNVRKK